ncbi:phosphotransferase family protein [Shimia aestuarii]|uniref:Predicted kinase, aminoglycoside phosphotransferase (APT) family n=1 Tax=Shimia aestuarii TaxID=254406 RepID=A0A1I4TNT7_9RHOB|nr:phosphotransferase family protein [Shimia aestuarii]SFM78444.1 Predicted kinase, aminoglycoside phosphotransferase (APT) family [Shimia aestuarii]
MDIDTANAALGLAMGANAPRVVAVETLQGGVSNLTYLLSTEGGERIVMRTPPIGQRSGNAHNMIREARVLSSVHHLFPEAPAILGFSEDPSATGDQFMLMAHIDGRSLPPGSAFDVTPEQARALCRNFVAALARLHSAPVTDAVSAAFGDPRGFVERQVAGWSRRYEKIGLPNARQPLLDWLAANIPADPERPSILHNDYKFDNLILDADDPTRILGVLDWELAGLGDPFLDLGNALAYWVEATDPPELHDFKRGPTDLPGMMTRDEIITAYCKERGLPRPASMDFYQAMGLFRLAVIALQVHLRLAGSANTEGAFLNSGLTLLNRAETIMGV